MKAMMTEAVAWSHPSWVCGLKLPKEVVEASVTLSHPSWVCGLKLSLPYFTSVRDNELCLKAL